MTKVGENVWSDKPDWLYYIVGSLISHPEFVIQGNTLYIKIIVKFL